MSEKKLYRSSTNKVLGGVLAGWAEYLGIDATVVRVAYCVLSLFTVGFPGLLLYIIMLLLMPQDRQ